MQYAAQERAARSRRHLSLKWGPALKRWALARRAAWRIEASCTPLELLARMERLRAGARWELLEDEDFDLMLADRIMCALADCDWRRSPPAELTSEHSLGELVQRATLAVPGLKPARVRHLLSRRVKAGRLERISRGRYAAAPWQWQHQEPVERFEISAADYRSWARCERARKNRVTVLLLHYLLPKLAVYRKSRALQISERTYYDRLAFALENFGSMQRPWAILLKNVQ
jgi:hypothetical protein